jgi:hypothetical protein
MIAPLKIANRVDVFVKSQKNIAEHKHALCPQKGGFLFLKTKVSLKIE